MANVMGKHLAVLAASLCVAACACGAGREKVVFVCGHPDDLAGVAGTALLLAERFDVKIVDFTKGEGGCGEAGYRDGSTARKRVAEERKACAMLGTEPVFLDEVNFKGREAFAGRKTTEDLRRLFAEWKPRAVILHWPMDTHPDHIQSYAASVHALHLAGLYPEIYLQEQTSQSRLFVPNCHVDITRVKEKKDKLILCYECQGAEDIRRHKEDDAIFRARRVGIKGYVESFAAVDGTVPPNHSVLREIGAW